jgi:hypothetical protein
MIGWLPNTGNHPISDYVLEKRLYVETNQSKMDDEVVQIPKIHHPHRSDSVGVDCLFAVF